MLTEQHLRRDLRAAQAAITKAHFDELRELGITFDAITRAGGIGTLNVQVHGRTWSTSLEGRPAWILPAWLPEEPGIYTGLGFQEAVLVNLIAWFAGKHDNGRFYLRSAAEHVVLGYSAMMDAAAEHHPTHIFGHPGEWLQNGCRGCCLASLFVDDLETTGYAESAA